ncbi:AfsR/SARP family transcriptional regulator [Paractinoplanes ferrugineus]|uniref:AfsR/SARP family transcriptional regulator n=1 Tax=Paractinoplanes ferrugineus TaxID=113564 RepID=UPI001EF356B1|nr:AfsR/SARP family transcriptional regulator [Actinoplanes ferrugineus]
MAITAGRDRVVLAMLLLNLGRVVDVPALVEALWAADPPATARAQLQTCVSRLRRQLPAGAIAHDPAGYRLTCEPDELDASVFARLVAEAKQESDGTKLRRALDLWRGETLVGLDSQAVRAAAAALDERYAAVAEDWAEFELDAGHDRDLIGELHALAERFPLRERLRGQLMRALHGAGRTGDALAEFRRLRAALHEELGIEPGRELQDLHRRILGGSDDQRVRSLPRTVGDFTGREAIVARLLESIAAAGPQGPAMVVIDGMAGSGKTTLALHVAALAGADYPDAHLFIDLHGHGEHEPAEPSAALLTLLRQLGIPPDRIPAEARDRVTMWRSELARRRVLVVLDNAHSSAQLADLLPTSAGTLALVTSRRRLVGLDGADPESLPLLTPADATALLARIAGDRVTADPAATAEVVRRCGGLPLALRLAGARLAHRPRWRVADLVRRLGESALPELAAEDRSVASAFALSYGQLAEPAKRMFRLLGVYPGVVLDGPAVAALCGLPLDEAQDTVDDLIDVHLVEEPAPGWYRLHDLLREFAATLAGPDRREALIGVLDLQTHAVALSMPEAYRDVLYRDLGSPVPLRPDLLAAITDPVARIERQRTHLAAYIEAAPATGRPEYAWWIARAAWWHLYYRHGGHGAEEMRSLLERAMSLMEVAGDRSGIAAIANYLASAYARLGDAERALELLRLSVRLREELGQRRAAATGLGNLAGVYEALGRFHECIDAARAARRMSALAGDRTRTRAPLSYLSEGYERLGRYPEALRYRRLSLLAAIEHQDHDLIASSLMKIERVRRLAGITTHGHRYLTAALRIAQRGAHLSVVSDIYNEMGNLLRTEGRYPEAMAAHETALTEVRRISNRRDEVDWQVDYAATRHAAGDADGALELLEAALAQANASRMRYSAARAEEGIAECVVGRDPERARRSWTAARATYRALGVPEQFRVELQLGGVDHLRSGEPRETMVR